MVPIRKAEIGDLAGIATLSSLKRKQYEQYQPVFHKEAGGAVELQTNYLKDVLSKDHVIALVHEEAGVPIDGFIIGSLVKAPPVYDPGGKICVVDDFMVSDPILWDTTGKELLGRVLAWAGEKGSVLANVVCGPRDAPKKEFLAGNGFGVATEWHVKALK